MAVSRNANYFPALDGLRAIAAFAVLWTHIERFKQSEGESTLCSIPFNSFFGGLSVTFFFVLSGFLITNLLLKEKSDAGSIQVHRFLKNRLLRIGPLYFLTLIAGYLVSILFIHDTGSNPFSNGLLLNLFMLSNIAFALGLIPEILVQIWSIGTEVQFYIFWPFLIRRTHAMKLSMIFIVIIAGWTLARAGLYMVGENKSVLAIILFRTRFDCMAIGGMAALMHREILMYNSFVNRFSQYLLKNAAGFLLFFLFLMMVFLSWKFDLSLYPLYSVLFACLIYRWINQPPKILTIPMLKWLGKISYGIYLLHHFAVYIAFGALFNYMGNSQWSELYYFAGASVVTIILASISYYGIERKFLRMKQKPIGNFQIETD